MTATRSARRPTAPSAVSRRPPLVPIVLGVILVLGVVAVVANRGGGDDVASGMEQTRPVTISGSALPPNGNGTDRALGAVMPEVDGESFAGEPLAIRRNGTPKLVLFLAHWCPHCRREVPVIVDWLAGKGRPDGVELISVSTSVNPELPNYPPSAWLEREGWDLPVVADDKEESAARAFGLSAFPFFVAVNGEGRVVARTSGELTVDGLEALVNQALGG